MACEAQCVARERDRHRRDGAALDHQQQRPAVQEAGKRMAAVTQVDVLAAGLWKQTAELCVRECASERNRPAGDPCGQHEHTAVERPRNEVGIDEDAGPDDAADHDHRRVEGPEGAAKGHAALYIGETSP
jgi:hypothetical protein